jgi:hypothetical protein
MGARIRVTLFAALATLLGSLSLAPLYTGLGWMPRVIGVVGAVALTSALAQRSRVLAPAAPVLMVLVLVAVLTVMYAHTVAIAGFIPGPAAFRLMHLTLSAGFDDTTQLSAPVGVTRGLSFMTTGGVGLVAVVVETLATALRRPAVAGLPLLAIFTVPAAILNRGVGWAPFVFSGAGFVALLLADGRERISRWGRPVGTVSAQRFGAAPTAARRVGATVATGQLTRAGRRIGATALGAAVLLPLAIPGLHAGWFGTHHTDGAAIGPGGGNSISPIVTLRRDLSETTPHELFSYTTSGHPEYLRMLTLDHFDGTQWSASELSSPNDAKVSDSLPAPVGVSIKPAAQVHTTIAVTSLNEPFLPVPMQPVGVKAHGDWLYNPDLAIVYSRHNNTQRLTYDVTSNSYSPDPSYLNTVQETETDRTNAHDLDVPADVPSVIRVQADAIVADAKATTPYEVAVALQAWFQTNFRYDVNARSGSDDNALLSFLQDRTGYCEQFAATMALMARIEGIPARVDVGFTPGQAVAGTTTYSVTTADAHAWPELFFPGAGWLRFEPTPRSDGQTNLPGYANSTAGPKVNASAGASSTSTAGPGAHPSPHLPNEAAPPKQGGQPSAHHGASFRLSVPWVLITLVIVLAAATAPTARWWTRRRRWAFAATDADRTHAAWADLNDEIRDLGLEWRGMDDTPRRAAAAIVATRRLRYDETAQQALARLSHAEELARYASPGRVRLVETDVRDDVHRIRHALYESVPRSRRLLARVAPASGLRYLGDMFATAADATHASLRSGLRRLRRPGNGDGST